MAEGDEFIGLVQQKTISDSGLEEDMAYSEGFSVSVNLIGTIDCDSVKGCEGNCYAGDCYALRTAQRFGWDFHDWKIRRFADDEREKFIRHIKAAQKQSKGREWARIGVMGDPSLSWANTVRVAGLIKDAGLVPVVISKHRRIASDEQFKGLIDVGAILHTSICTLDGPVVKDRYAQALRYKKLGGKSLIRLITFEAGKDDDKTLMKWFIDNSSLPILETPMRMTKNNKHVKSGRVTNPNRTIEMTKRVCAAIPPNDCYSCKEQCGVDLKFNTSADEMYDGVLALFQASQLLNQDTLIAGETASEMDLEWTTAFINELPNSAFAVIEPDYLESKTEDKNCRHLPYKDKDGKIDLPHLRNAMARLNQIKAITSSITTEALREKAMSVLEPIAMEHLESSQYKKDYITQDSLSDGVTMTLTADSLVKDYGVPADKAKELISRIEDVASRSLIGSQFTPKQTFPPSGTQPAGGSELIGGSGGGSGYLKTARGTGSGMAYLPVQTGARSMSNIVMPFSQEELDGVKRWGEKLWKAEEKWEGTAIKDPGGSGNPDEPTPVDENERKDKTAWDNFAAWWVSNTEALWGPILWTMGFIFWGSVGYFYIKPRMDFYLMKKNYPEQAARFKDYKDYRLWTLERQGKIPPRSGSPGTGSDPFGGSTSTSPAPGTGTEGSAGPVDPFGNMMPAGGGQSAGLMLPSYFSSLGQATLAPYQMQPGVLGTPAYGAQGYGIVRSTPGFGGYGAGFLDPGGIINPWEGAVDSLPTINDVAEFIKKNDELVGGSRLGYYKQMRGIAAKPQVPFRPTAGHAPGLQQTPWPGLQPLPVPGAGHQIEPEAGWPTASRFGPKPLEYWSIPIMVMPGQPRPPAYVYDPNSQTLNAWWGTSPTRGQPVHPTLRPAIG